MMITILVLDLIFFGIGVVIGVAKLTMGVN
jgi:hypothetical protein